MLILSSKISNTFTASVREVAAWELIEIYWNKKALKSWAKPNWFTVAQNKIWMVAFQNSYAE